MIDRFNISSTLVTLITLILLITTSITHAKDTFETGYFLGADNNKLFYRHSGIGKENIIYLHGGPGFDATDGGYELDALAENYHLIAYDQRGGGNSEVIKDLKLMSAEHHVEDLEALRKHFKFEKMTLMGMSWGTGLALLYTNKYPHRVDKLLITAPMPLNRSMLNYRYQQLGPTLSKEDAAAFAAARAKDLTNASDEEIIQNCKEYIPLAFKRYLSPYSDWSKLKGDFCAPNPQGIKMRWINSKTVIDKIGDYDWRDIAKSIKIPTYITEGALTTVPISTTNEWAALMPNARIKYIEKSGHIIWLDDPQQVVADTESFMKGQWPQGSYRINPTHLGLIARYSFENTMVNAQDNWFHPKATGKTSYTSNRFKRQNAALKLGDTNSAVTIPQAQWYVEDDSWTISGWFKIENIKQNNQSIITQGSSLQVNIKDNKLNLKVSGRAITSTNDFEYNRWQHIAISRNKDTYTLYTNNKLVAAGSLAGTQKPQGDFVISNMIGKIDDIRVYAQARTEQQLEAIYYQLDTE